MFILTDVPNSPSGGYAYNTCLVEVAKLYIFL